MPGNRAKPEFSLKKGESLKTVEEALSSGTLPEMSGMGYTVRLNHRGCQKIYAIQRISYRASDGALLDTGRSTDFLEGKEPLKETIVN